MTVIDLVNKFNNIFKHIKKESKIVVASSGGLDSTVILFLLKINNFNNVVSLTMKHLLKERTDSKSCCSIKDIVSLKDICLSELNFMHYTVDLHDIFSKKIKREFIRSIEENLTPNPCAECNKHIKFGALRDIALNILSADIFVTGHYAKIINEEIYCSVDPTKDQSYFLSLVPKKQLKNVVLPLGYIKKEEIINFSKKHNILKQLFKYKKESQGVCFINSNWKTYIDQNIKLKAGWGVYKNKIITRFNNINIFTIGQKWFSKSHKRFLIVVKKKENLLILDDKPNFSNLIFVSNVNLMFENKYDQNNLYVVFRYHAVPLKCYLTRYKNFVLIITVKSVVESCTPGQIAAVYQNLTLKNSKMKKVIFGGKILKTI